MINIIQDMSTCELQDVYNSCIGLVDTAKKLGVNRLTLRKYLQNHNIQIKTAAEIRMLKTKKYKFPYSKDELQEIYNTHISLESTSKFLNISHPTLKKYLKEYGIDIISKKEVFQRIGGNIDYPTKPKTKRELQDNYNSMSIETLSKFYGVSKSIISHWLEEFSIIIINKRCKYDIINSHPQLVSPKKDKLQDNYNSMSVRELMIYYKVSQQTIYKWFGDVNIIKRKNPANWRGSRNFLKSLPSKKELEQKYKELGF